MKKKRLPTFILLVISMTVLLFARTCQAADELTSIQEENKSLKKELKAARKEVKEWRKKYKKLKRKYDKEISKKEAPLSFTLSWDTLGEYGEEITLNEGTDFPYSCIAFHIPAGTYSIKNKAATGCCQVTVYSGIDFDGQWEEFSNEDCDGPVLIWAGEGSEELIIKEGQFVKLSDGNSNIEFLKK